jgi:hypothetical protein
VKVDVEVIEPEVGHDFLELGVGVDVADEALGDSFEITRPRSEGKAVEGVQDAGVALQLGGLVGRPGRTGLLD